MATKTANKIEYYEKKLADAEKRLEQYKIDGDTNKIDGVNRWISFYKKVIRLLKSKQDITVNEENQNIVINSSSTVVGLTTTKTIVKSVSPYITEEIIVPLEQQITNNPTNLSAFQTEAYTNLIKINPKGWESQIENLNTNYPDLFTDVKPYTAIDINDFDRLVQDSLIYLLL